MSYNTAKSMMNSTIGHIQSVDQENAKRFYDETTTSNMINQQKSSLINNMAGASLEVEFKQYGAQLNVLNN